MATPQSEPSRQDLLAEVKALRQERDALLAEVESLRQERDDLDIMLETTTDHFDHLSEALRQERDDLKTLLEVTTDHFDHLAEALRQERDDLKTLLEVTTDHFDHLAEALRQERDNVEIILGITTDHFDHLSETLRQERDDLKTMLEATTAHFDHLSKVLQQERDDLATMLDMTTDHSDMIEAELHDKTEELEKWNQFIRDTFGRYVSDDVVASLLDSPEGIQLGGEKRQVTILMSDLRGFTVLAERLEPHEVMRFLNHYLEAMVQVILSYQGTIIEILGDGLLVIFGAPISRDDDPERAVACAVAMQLQMEGVNVLLRQEGLPAIEMGIGIHTGEVVVGNIGSQQRTKYGVVGNPVNLTGRIESYTIGNQILISPTTYKETASLLRLKQELRVEPKGMPAPMTIYEVGGIGGMHQLFLPDDTEALFPLNETIAVRYVVLEEKFAGRTVFTGRLIRLSAKAAELQTDLAVAVLSDLKLQLLTHSGEVIPGELFAKVVEAPTENATRVVIRFTSVPEAVKAFLAHQQ